MTRVVEPQEDPRDRRERRERIVLTTMFWGGVVLVGLLMWRITAG